MSEFINMDANHILLQIFRYLGKENDSSMYLYDVEKHVAFFNEHTAKLFDIPDVVSGMPDTIMKKDFLLPESQEEFIRLHHMVEGDALEVTGLLKLRTVKGIDIVYELKLSRILNEDGTKTPATLGRFKDVTERYILDKESESYNKLIDGSRKFPFVYNKKKDIMKYIMSDGENSLMKERSFYFYSKMIKEEQVCSKHDISILLDIMANGCKKPIQLELFDPITEEYRWFAISAKIDSEKPDEVKGVLEDITDKKSIGNNKERLYKVLNILSADYIFIVEIDLLNNHYDALLCDFDRMGFNFPESGSYKRANEAMCEHVSDAHRKARLEFGNIDNIIQGLKVNNKLVMEFMTDNEKLPWRKAVFQCSETDEFGNPTKALLSHIYIDENELESYSVIEKYNEGNEDEEDKILIVEDFELNAKLAIDSAKIAGMNADWVASKEEAITKLSKKNSRYKLIFMDDKLKDSTGIEASKEIREMNIEVPIILCSLNDNKDLDAQCEQAGITTHVSKPLVAKQLKYLREKYIQ